MPVTLFLTRNPLKEFLFRGVKSGRFGELIAVQTGKVASARLIAGGTMPMPALTSMGGGQMPVISRTAQMPAISRTAQMPAISRTAQMPAISRTAQMPVVSRAAVMEAMPRLAFTPDTQSKQYVRVEHGVLEITFAPLYGNVAGPTPLLTAVKRFTTMERFKADSGSGFYVQLRPRPTPYWISRESNNHAVKGIRTGHDGRCFRVHGGRSEAEKGILIHEAPHVGWVIGCIGPRPLKNFALEFANTTGNESYKSMDELFAFVGYDRADLFVLDW